MSSVHGIRLNRRCLFGSVVLGLGLAGALLPGGLLAVSAAAQTKALNDFTATRDRPLFSPARRPAPLPRDVVRQATEVAAPPPLQPTFEVSGVIVGTDVQTAIVRHPGDPKATTVMVGTEIDGWTVSAIRPREVVVQREAQTVTLALPVPGH